MSFVYPYMLWGLLAWIVPIVVHLFYLRRWKKVAFSNVQMLQDVHVQTRKKQKLKDRWLLLSRLAAIFCLVMVFAQPYRGASPEELLDEKVRYTSLFVDNSFSMSAKTVDGDLLSDAKKQAYEWVKRFRPSDKFHLLTQDFSKDNQRWISREEMLEEIHSIDIAPYAHTLSAVMKRQEQLVSPLAEFSPRTVVVSDFQRSFADVENLPSTTPYRRVFCPIQASDSDNLSVDSLALENPVLQKGQTIELKIYLRNQSREIQENVSVKVMVQGKVEAVSSCRVLANERLELVMPLTLKEKGWVKGVVEIEDYPIQFDDRLFFSLHVLDRIPILHLYNEAPNPFLERLFSSDRSFEYKSLSIKNLDISELANASLVLLPEMKSLSSGLQAEVIKAVEQGASLFVAPEKDADLSSFKDIVKNLFAASVDFRDQSQLEVASADFTHPLLHSGIQKVPEQNLWPTVNDHFLLSEKSPARFQTLLRLNNADPFLVYAPYREGNAYLLTSPLTAEASDWVHHPLFVLCFLNMALQSTASERIYYDLIEQDRVILRATGKNAQEIPFLRSEKDDLELRPHITYQGNRWRINTHFALKEAGNYSLETAVDRWGILSFNYSRKESDRSFYTPKTLQKQLDEENILSISIEKSLEQASDIQKSLLRATVRDGKWFILLCLLFLLAELIIIKYWFIFAKQKK